MTLVSPCAKGMLTTLVRKFETAAAATIDVSLCRRTMTVIAAIASAMKQARAIPRMSAPTRALPTMIATPQSATTLASMVRRRGISPSHIQASPAARNGPVAMMMATLDTLVSCSAGMKAIMPSVEHSATSQPLVLIPIRSRKPARPCNRTMRTVIRLPPNNPRQNRMVQESYGSSRVKNGAVLKATAAIRTRAMPRRCWDCASAK